MGLADTFNSVRLEKKETEDPNVLTGSYYSLWKRIRLS